MLNINSFQARQENDTTSQSELTVNSRGQSAETNICLGDVAITDGHLQPPRLESIDSAKQQNQQQNLMTFTSLCNPNEEDNELRGYHSSIFSLDDVEMPALAEGCNCEQNLIMLIA